MASVSSTIVRNPWHFGLSPQLLRTLRLTRKFCFLGFGACTSRVSRHRSRAAPRLARDFLQLAARDDRDLLLPRDIVGVTAVMRGIADSRRP
jgi:hypothetical protein